MVDPDESEPLTRGDTYELANRVIERTATPDQARQLIEGFVEQANRGAVDDRLIQHVRDCFDAFITGKPDSLDQAFGLVRDRRGRPALDEHDQIDAASDYLAERLAGKSDLEAREVVAAARKGRHLPVSSETQVAEAWSSYKCDALLQRRLGRAERGEQWTRDELARLRAIYRDVPAVLFPGVALPEGPAALGE